MKQQIKNKKMAKRQDWLSIEDASTGADQTTKRVLPKFAVTFNHPSYGGRLCKGPPGRARSPGIALILFPEHLHEKSRRSDHPPDNQNKVVNCQCLLLNYRCVVEDIIN